MKIKISPLEISLGTICLGYLFQSQSFYIEPIKIFNNKKEVKK